MQSTALAEQAHLQGQQTDQWRGCRPLHGRGDFLPVEMRLAHIDRNQPVFVLIGGQDASQCLESVILFSAFIGKPLHHAACAVATGLRLCAVTIDDLNIMIGAGRFWIMDRHDLVKGSCLFSGQTDGSSRSDTIAASRISATMILLPSPFILAKMALLIAGSGSCLYRKGSGSCFVLTGSDRRSEHLF